MRKAGLHSKLRVLSFCLAFLPAFLAAQQSNTFYLMQQVPQNNLLNPAVQIPCKIYVGLPVLYSLYANYSNSAFTYKDIAGDTAWNLEALADQSHHADYYNVETQIGIIGLGYRHRGQYFTFNILERGLALQTIPGDLVNMGVYGNAAFVGEEVKMNSFRPMGIHAREYSLGYARSLGPYLEAGIRAKLLFGKANASAGRSRINTYTTEDNFQLGMAADYTFNTSFPYTVAFDDEGNPDGIESVDLDPIPYMMNRSNPGFAIDLGIIYAYSEEITLSASLLDLGFIRWRSDTYNFHGEGSYDYTGIDLSSELGSASFIWEAIDTVMSHLTFSTTTEAYTSYLPTQLYLGAAYQYSEHISFGLVNRNVVTRGKWHASFTASASASLRNKFNAVLSWSYLNNSVKNLGVGLAWHGKGFQVHAATDNILTAFYPFDSRILNLRVGMNLMLGCPRSKRDMLEQEAQGHSLPGGECPFPEKPEKKKKKRMKAVRRINR